MRKVLQGLFYGEFNAIERKIHRTAENKALRNKIGAEEEYFEQILSEEDSKRFADLQDLYSESICYEQEEAFAYGFKLASMIMCAVFHGNEELTSQVN